MTPLHKLPVFDLAHPMKTPGIHRYFSTASLLKRQSLTVGVMVGFASADLVLYQQPFQDGRCCYWKSREKANDSKAHGRI